MTVRHGTPTYEETRSADVIHDACGGCVPTYGHLIPDAEDLGRGAIGAIFAVAVTEHHVDRIDLQDPQPTQHLPHPVDTRGRRRPDQPVAMRAATAWCSSPVGDVPGTVAIVEDRFSTSAR